MHIPSNMNVSHNYTATGEWTTPSTSGTPPTPRQGHIVAVVGNKMFVHGGMSGQQIFNDLYALNLGKLYSLIIVRPRSHVFKDQSCPPPTPNTHTQEFSKYGITCTCEETSSLRLMCT